MNQIRHEYGRANISRYGFSFYSFLLDNVNQKARQNAVHQFGQRSVSGSNVGRKYNCSVFFIFYLVYFCQKLLKVKRVFTEFNKFSFGMLFVSKKGRRGGEEREREIMWVGRDSCLLVFLLSREGESLSLSWYKKYFSVWVAKLWEST